MKASAMTIINSIFKTFVLSLLVIAQVNFAYADTASILPPAKTTFVDKNGKPLTLGTVDFYIPGTSTRKTTWQDAAETIPNSNPVTLDAAGRALILGSGSYRQVVKDRLGNTIWDQVTSSTGSGGSTPVIATGDGDLVGTVKPWAGMTAPNQYMFTYGQEISRVTYASLYTAITSSQAVFCNSGSPILNGLSDTTNFWIGMSVEISCTAAGFSTVIDKTATTVTLAANSNVTTNTTAVFYPWGRGNGSTTFNLPDFRGLSLSGNNNMGGVASANSTVAWFGATNPNSIGAKGGTESYRLSLPNIPDMTSVNLAQAITVSTTSHLPISSLNWAGTTISVSGAVTMAFTGGSVGSTQSIGPTNNSISTTYTNAGGGAGAATIAAGGSGYTSGNQIITLTGGTCSIAPQYTVTVVAGAITNPVLYREGLCTVKPTNPAATSGGGGTGGTLTVSYGQAAFPTVSPTKTVNYIIKVTPDTNAATASGVTSFGLMTGDIACGSGLLCTGNNVSVPLASSGVTGSGAIVLQNTPTLITPTLGVATATSINKVTITAPATSSTLTIDDGKTLRASNSLTFAGTDATTLTFPTTNDTILGRASTDTITGVKTFGAAGNVGKLVIAGTTSGSTVLNASATASGTLTLPAATDTLMGKATTDILTNKTFNSTATGNVLQVSGVTVSAGQYPGEPSTSNATAGNVGEYIESVIVAGSATSLTTGTAKTITSISLTAGDWDVTGNISFNTAVGTSVTGTIASLSGTTNTNDATPGRQAGGFWGAIVPGSATAAFSTPVGPYRFSVSGATNVFLVATGFFTASTLTGHGIIRARRVR